MTFKVGYLYKFTGKGDKKVKFILVHKIDGSKKVHYWNVNTNMTIKLRGFEIESLFDVEEIGPKEEHPEYLL